MSAAALALASTALGFAAWTLVEYAGHRWVMHGPLSNQLRREHLRHHRSPVNPSLVTSAVYGIVALALVAVAGWVAAEMIGPPGALMSLGFAVGVVAYMFSHQMTHRTIDVTDRWYALPSWRAHLTHHFVRSSANFGFTTSFWDRVFRTRD